MLKKIIFLALFGLCVGQSFAQNTSLGVRLGLNVSSVKWNNGSSDSKAGANFGLLLTKSIHENLGITGEALFTMKGGNTVVPNGTVNYNYLQIPVFASYYLGKAGSSSRPKIFGGAYWAYLLSAKAGDVDFSSTINKSDYGLVFGLGWNFRIKNANWLCADIRYDWGLGDISNASRHHVYSLNLAYTLPLGDY